jgi:hypothetical protein
MAPVRIRKHIDAPIPELPELTPMVGKTVEIIVVERPDVVENSPHDFWNPATLEELATAQGVGPATSLEQLRSREDMSNAFDGFEETLKQWRREPWSGGDK